MRILVCIFVFMTLIAHLATAAPVPSSESGESNSSKGRHHRLGSVSGNKGTSTTSSAIVLSDYLHLSSNIRAIGSNSGYYQCKDYDLVSYNDCPSGGKLLISPRLLILIYN